MTATTMTTTPLDNQQTLRARFPSTKEGMVLQRSTKSSSLKHKRALPKSILKKSKYTLGCHDRLQDTLEQALRLTASQQSIQRPILTMSRLYQASQNTRRSRQALDQVMSRLAVASTIPYKMPQPTVNNMALTELLLPTSYGVKKSTENLPQVTQRLAQYSRMSHQNNLALLQMASSLMK